MPPSSAPRRPSSSTRCPTTISRAGSTPPRTSPTRELSLDLYAESRTHAERAVCTRRATGQGARFPSLSIVLGSIATVEARFADAAEILAGAVEAARLAGDAQGLAWMLLNRGLLATTGKGDVELGLAAGEECRELTRSMDRSYITDWSQVVLARALLQAGDARRAVEVMAEPAADDFSLIPCGWRIGCFELLTRCSIALDRPAEAQAAASAARDARRRSSGFRSRRRWRSGPRARWRSSSGTASVRSSARSPRPSAWSASLRRSRSRSRARSPGSAFALAGERDRAMEELSWAAATCEEHGAELHFLEAEQELRRLGHRRHRPGQARGTEASGIGALSTRELEVAQARRRPPHEPRNRRRAVPQPQDGRDAHAQHLPQAGRHLARGRRARARARRALIRRFSASRAGSGRASRCTARAG